MKGERVSVFADRRSGGNYWFARVPSANQVSALVWDSTARDPRSVVPPLIELCNAYLSAQSATGTSLAPRVHSVAAPSSSIGSAAKAIRKAHEDSGLTWEQLARIFGVSRRSLHLWANGARMNATNAEMLMDFLNLIEVMDAGSPPERRTALLTLGADGRSVLDNFRSRYLERRGQTSAQIRPDEYLGALHDDVTI